MTTPEPKKNIWRIPFRRYLRPLLGNLIAWTFYLVTNVVYRTFRVTYFDKEHEDQYVREGKPILFVSWHQGLLYYPFYFRNRNGIIMTSKSQDGNIIAKILKLYGFQTPPRGSSSRAGKQAMYEMIERLKTTSSSGGLVADAPRGPFGVAKMGIIKIARETGYPLIPVMWWAKWVLKFRSWDRTLLPLPFTRLVFYYSDPIYVPSDSTPEQMEKIRGELTDRLNLMLQGARTYFAHDKSQN